MGKIKLMLEKSKPIYRFFSFIKLFIYYIYYSFFMYMFRIFSIKKNRIICVSYSGKGYGDNGKYIINELLKDKEEYQIIWSTKRSLKNGLPHGVKYVCYNSPKYLYYLSTAKIWINNSRFNYGIKKRKGQYYIQTWHGSIPIKKVEKDTEKTLAKNYIKRAKSDAKMVDLLISNSKFSTELYKRAFWGNPKILEKGSPRNDILVNKDEKIKKKVYRYFNLDKNEKVILYAPTFRNDITKCTYNIDFSKVREEFCKKYNEKYKILIRLHPILSNRKDLFKYDKNILNATDYLDIQELLLSADILITDYSSTMFDYMLLKRPIIIYINDYDRYEKERETYFNIRELPFIVVKDNTELIEKIKKINIEKINNSYEQFFSKIGLKEDGKASKEIANIIKKRIEENE